MTTPAAAAAAPDADLDDLLHDNDHEGSSSSKQHLEMAPLNLDHLTKGQLDVTPSPTKHSSAATNVMLNPLEWIHASCLYLAYAHPKLCSCSVVLVILGGIMIMAQVVLNPTLTVGDFGDVDFSLINSKYDLQQGQIDHWCLDGSNDHCRCSDPLIPEDRGEYKTWVHAHNLNKAEVKNHSSAEVVILGESLVEEMMGRWMGNTKGPQLSTMRSMFDQKFQSLSVIALGIAGDTSPNVLWRLQHGEMVPKAKLWWLSLGMNDLGRMQCSEQVVVMGILRVVEEILEQSPNTRVVINSMLPMADLRGGMYPQKMDPPPGIVNSNKASRYARKPPPKNNNKGRSLKKDDKKDIPLNVQKAINDFQLRSRASLPMLDNRNHLKKYHHLFQKNKMPLWTSIHAINEELRKFCIKHAPRVVFYDATPLFAERVEYNKYVLISDMISMRGHPTVAGYLAWETAMAKKMASILAQEEEEESLMDYDSEDESSASTSRDAGAGRKQKSSSSSSSDSSKE